MAGDSSVVRAAVHAGFDTRPAARGRQGRRAPASPGSSPTSSATSTSRAIDLNPADGVLHLTTTGTSTAGGPLEGDNTLVNGLQTQFNAQHRRVHHPHAPRRPARLHRRTPSEQGGIIFGPDQDNYVKLVAVAQPGRHVPAVHRRAEGRRQPTYTHQISSAHVADEHRQLRRHQHARPRASPATPRPARSARTTASTAAR